MRIFEVTLIVVNVLSLFLYSKKQPKSLWIAGLNLSVLFIHGLFEGFRYQMFFSYCFVGLFTASALIRAFFNFRARTPRVLRIIALSLSFTLIVITTFLAYALPVFTLPKPTGTYDVGVQYFHLVDEDRNDPFLSESTQKRELMVKVHYPSKKDDAESFAPYFHTPQLTQLFAEFYGMPDFMFAHLNLVKTNSKESLAISDNQPNYPVILFSHGAGTTMEVHTSQSEDLASHGYVVVTIDHTYVSAGTVFPDRIVLHKEATTNFDVVEPAEIITQIMADDSSFVIDTLEEMNEGKTASIFKGKLNLDQLGAIGHSVGGAVAYSLAINDNRVKAAIDLDGVVYLTPNGNPKEVAPFLLLGSDQYIPTVQSQRPLMKKFEEMDDMEQKFAIEIHGSKEAYNEAYHRAQQNVTGLTEVLGSSGNLFMIEGSNHMKFTDIGLFIGLPQLRELFGIDGETDPARCLEITEALTVAFFDQHLKGETDVSLESLLQKYPELKRVELK